MADLGMARPALRIQVKKKDQKELKGLLSGGVPQVRVVLRALALLQLAEDASAPQIAKVIPLTPQAIRRLGHRYQHAGLHGCSPYVRRMHSLARSRPYSGSTLPQTRPGWALGTSTDDARKFEP